VYIIKAIKNIFLFINNYFKSVVFLTILAIYLNNTTTDKLYETPNVALIEIKTPIFDIKETLKEIKEANQQNNIKGVLIDIDSPGGSVSKSVELSEAIKRLKANKPVIVYCSGILASGSYYASIWADEIIANSGSLIGSIGVIFQSGNFQELFSKLGVKLQNQIAGKYKETGTPTRKWKDFEKQELKKVIDDMYDIFVSDVAKARKLNKQEHTKFADAHIFTARQAKQVGLIDSIGTIKSANDKLLLLSKVKKPIWKKREQDKFKNIQDLFENSFVKVINNLMFGNSGLQ
jgi:protease-4